MVTKTSRTATRTGSGLDGPDAAGGHRITTTTQRTGAYPGGEGGGEFMVTAEESRQVHAQPGQHGDAGLRGDSGMMSERTVTRTTRFGGSGGPQDTETYGSGGDETHVQRMTTTTTRTTSGYGGDGGMGDGSAGGGYQITRETTTRTHGGPGDIQQGQFSSGGEDVNVQTTVTTRRQGRTRGVLQSAGMASLADQQEEVGSMGEGVDYDRIRQGTFITYLLGCALFRLSFAMRSQTV